MKLLAFTKIEQGWTLELDTEKKPFPRQRDAQSIKMTEFFPHIPLLGDGFPPKAGEKKVYGSVIVKGTMSFFPISETKRMKNSPYWAHLTKEESGIVSRENTGMIPRQKEPMDIPFDKDYVFDGKQWVPFLVWQYLNEAKVLVAEDREALFHSVLAQADKDEEAILTVFEAFKTPVIPLPMPSSLKIRQVVPTDVAQGASTFHYSGETKRNFNPFNGPATAYKRTQEELMPEQKYMSPLQAAIAQKLGLVKA